MGIIWAKLSHFPQLDAYMLHHFNIFIIVLTSLLLFAVSL